MDASGTKCVTEVPLPSQVTDLTFFLLPGVMLPPGSGVALYYAMPPFTEWTVLGALTAEKPRCACVGKFCLSIAVVDRRVDRSVGVMAHDSHRPALTSTSAY